MAGPQYNFDAVDALNKEEHYTSLPQKALAGLEGVGKGLSLNASDYALAKTGLTSIEDIKAREEYNPAVSLAGTGLGAAGLTFLTGGAAAPVEEAVMASRIGQAAATAVNAARVAGEAAPMAARALPAAAKAIGLGTEGAAYALGTNAVDTTLGDQEANGQKIAADAGFGFLLGSGLGLLSHGIGARLGSKAAAMHEAADAVKPGDVPEALAGEIKDHNPGAVYDPSKTGIAPKSLEEIEQRIKEAPFKGESTELPSADVLRDASSRIPMSNPILDMQIESTASQEGRNTYNIAKETGGKIGKILNDYESLQKNELVKRTDSEIQALSGGKPVISDAVENGKHAIDAFTEQYQAEKEMLGPHFEALKNTDISNIDHMPGVLAKMTDAVPGVARMFDTAGDGIHIHPYKTSWGIDKSTYSAVKQAVESLEGGSKTFEELQNIRKGLDQNINILDKGQGSREIMALKKSMMDYMQEELERSNPFVKGAGGDEVSVRDLFKRYAINEQERGVIEKAFGASVGTPEFGAISKVKPEEILDKVFKNTATVQAAKKILSPEKFNELLANHLAEQKALATDKGIFSSNKFGSYLKKNQDALGEAFRDNPSALQKIKDINTISRMIPDAAPINPSGTAKTLMGMLKVHSLPELLHNVNKALTEHVQEKLYERKINEMLAGKAETAEKMGMIKKIIQKTSDKIDSGAKAIFSDKSSGLSLIAPILKISDEDYKKNVRKIQEFSHNPEIMMDHLGTNSKELYAVAPNITSGLHNTLIRGVQFLATQIPSSKVQMPLSKPFEPSRAQMYKFNSLYRTVESPLSALDDIKKGDLTMTTMNVLKAVHPDLLKEMQMSVMENFDQEKAKDLDYPVKMSLAKFFGQPLDEHMMPQVMNSYQSSMMMQKQQPDGIKPTSKGIREIGKSERISTRTNQADEV